MAEQALYGRMLHSSMHQYDPFYVEEMQTHLPGFVYLFQFVKSLHLTKKFLHQSNFLEDQCKTDLNFHCQKGLRLLRYCCFLIQTGQSRA